MIDFNILLIAALLANSIVTSTNMSYMYIPQKRKDEIVFDIAYSLVWEAERLYGAKSGLIKHAYVKAKMYVILSAMPPFRNSIIDGVKLGASITRAVAAMHQYMSEVKVD